MGRLSNWVLSNTSLALVIWSGKVSQQPRIAQKIGTSIGQRERIVRALLRSPPIENYSFLAQPVFGYGVIRQIDCLNIAVQNPTLDIF